ncbi:hypothetical protein [Peribacillus asahii]|uniref:hypothetical protein n=1 Tax=Peribacillus asahii TaxID=228899 RepID=UPI002079FFBF|nr:hypothetical protein [Peribacillus asahii]USK86173.1 hypothetical protein LIT35_05895 [Peribacillus asahii]
MFKKVLNSWAKEMDKQRYKEQDKRKKRVYYVDVCTNHADMIQEVVQNCEEYVLRTDELLTDDIFTEVKIEELEKCVDLIKDTIRTVSENSKVYDLPPNAKQAYHDSIKHLLTGLNHFLTAFETKLVLQRGILITETQELTQEEIDELQNSISSITPPAYLIDEYVACRKLQLEKYETALNIINNH